MMRQVAGQARLSAKHRPCSRTEKDLRSRCRDRLAQSSSQLGCL